MRAGLLRWQVLLTLLFWTAGVLALWIVVRLALNPDVTDEDIRECMGEGLIPPDECEEVLRELEDEPVVTGVPLLIVVWFAGLLLLSLVRVARRQRPASPR